MPHACRRATSTLLALFSLAMPSHAMLAWPHDPAFGGLVVCKAPGLQTRPLMVSDGDGGALLLWEDFRSGASSDLYAHHVLWSGVLDPRWPEDGLAVRVASASAYEPAVEPDGAGGMLVAWREGSFGTVRVQHVRNGGDLDPAWPADGQVASTEGSPEFMPALAADGTGGAFVVWQDLRRGNWDVFAQHLLATGDVAPGWETKGVLLSTSIHPETDAKVIADGAGGALVTWWDTHGLVGGLYQSDIFVQHLRADGSVDPAWPDTGRVLCGAPDEQGLPRIVSDGAGGALVVWEDYRGGGAGDVYAQHVFASGLVDPAWPVDGRPMTLATGPQYAVRATSDGAGGMIATWKDERSEVPDIYAQRVLASGQIAGGWSADGRGVRVGGDEDAGPAIASDGAGGALVAWYDYRSFSSYDLYVQHLPSTGLADPTWPTNGRALITHGSQQTSPVVVSDGDGGVLVTWADSRQNLYAQRMARHGVLGAPEAEIVDVSDVAGDQGGAVTVTWNASWLDAGADPRLAAYEIERGSVGAAPSSTVTWTPVGTVVATHAPQYQRVVATPADSASGDPATVPFRIVARNAAGTQTWTSHVVSGHSVDNLPPAEPVSLVGRFEAGVMHLHWSPNSEPDLAGYRVHRGTSVDFVPAVENLVTTRPDTGYADAAGAPFVYKLVAVDVHGNASTPATLSPGGVAGASRAAVEPFLRSAGPNPVHGPADVVLRFAVAAPGRARLAVFDVVGRRVRVLAEGALGAGEHAARWDGRDDRQRDVGPGLFFVRLESPGYAATLRIVRTR